VADAFSTFDEVCMVSHWHAQTPQALALAARVPFTFSPEADPQHDPDPCSVYRVARHNKSRIPFFAQVRVASCIDQHASAVYPCAEGGLVNITPNKYCRRADNDSALNVTEAAWMNQCARVSAPILSVSLEEWFVHADNIGHVGRDLAYITSMLRLGLKNGYSVVVPPLPTFKPMLPWGKAILQALAGRGLQFSDWRDQAQRFAKVSIRAARDASVRDVDASPCGVVCVTKAVRIGSGAYQPDDVMLLQQTVLEWCGLPLEPPTNRTLLLSRRKAGGTRAFANLPAITARLRPFAESHGLQYETVVLGNLDFCGQVSYASRAYIMVGVHGAELINMFWLHKDATLIEMHGRDRAYWNASLPSHMDPAAGITTYMQQVATTGRRGLALKLFNVTSCASQDWMYDRSCVIRLDADALLAAIGRWIPMPRVREHPKREHQRPGFKRS